MKTIVHVGPHKTGTTFIQQQFHLHSTYFRDKGWIYPEVGIPSPQHGHHHLAYHPEDYLPPGSRHHDELRAVGSEAANLVFSAEGLCVWDHGAFEALRAALGRPSLRLVYFVRDPYDTFYSHWKEQIKQGFTDSLPERHAAEFADPRASRLLNPLIDLARYEADDTRISLAVYPYDHLMAKRMDIFATLTETELGVDGHLPPKHKAPNAATSIELTEFLRLLIVTVQAKAPQLTGREIRHRFYALRRGGAFEAVERAFAGAAHLRKSIVEPRQVPFYRDLAEAICAVHGSRLAVAVTPGALFPQGPKVMDYYELDDLKTVAPIRVEIERYTPQVLG